MVHPIKSRLPPEILARVRKLRREATDAEQFLWYFLRNRAMDNAKFRRQHPMRGYVLDFYCHELKLAIELDGSGHLEPDQERYDAKRTALLAEEGIQVLRFRNSDLFNHSEEVLGVIWESIEERRAAAPSHCPPPKGEGRQVSLSHRERGEGPSGDEIVTVTLIPYGDAARR
jgi:very-short-patch-repair endonuclease